MSNLQPFIKDIPFASPLHGKIIKHFKSRLKIAQDEQAKKRLEKWKDSENTFTAYLPETEADNLRKDTRKRGGTAYTTIAIPYSYAMLLTAHTYYTSVFLARDPIFQVKGRHGEGQDAELAMECLLDYQLTGGNGTPALFIWLMDIAKYGHGVLGHYWDREVFTMQKQMEVPKSFMGLPIPGTATKKLIGMEVEGFCGNRLYNVRPADFFPDPRLPLHRFQEGEFCIEFDKIGWVKAAQMAADGLWYNIEELKKQGARESSGEGRSSVGHDTNLPGESLSYYEHEGESSNPLMLDKHTFHWNLIPSELGLGSSTRPEKWV